MSVIAFDPGGKTGVAIRMNDGSFVTCYIDTIFRDDKGKETFNPKDVYSMIVQPNIDQIVYEDYFGETITKYGLHTVRLVGAIEALGWRLDIPVSRHTPHERKPFLTESKKLLVDRGEAYVVHEMDALAHLLCWEYRNGRH